MDPIAVDHSSGSRSARPAGRVGGLSDRIEGLDGLRALAIAAVLVFHLNAPWLRGGFLGVDVFFVVSGFLITTLLVREHERTGRIVLRHFWVRRARRLLPALVVCVTVSVLIARLVSGDLLVHVARQVAGAFTFSTNWVEITAGTSYFDQTAPQLFMNFWSLAVEEQFYLVWPIATLILLRHAPLRGRVAAALGIAAASSLLMTALYVPGSDATRVYYGTDTHVMGLMIGAAVAFAWASPTLAARLRPSSWGRPGRFAVPVAGLVLLSLFVMLDEAQPATFRGGILLASAATAVLILGLLDRPGHSTAWQRLTMSRPAAWVGVRSYSLYLWHWPVILMVAHAYPSAPGTISHVWTRAWCVLITVALADLTFRFVETPFRRFGFRGMARWAGEALLRRPRQARLAFWATMLVGVATVTVILVTAPNLSQTAEMLDANAARAAQSPADAPMTGAAAPTTGAAAPATGASAPKPGATTTANTTADGAASTTRRTIAAAADFTMPTGRQIDAYGDSMMVGSVHALEYYFPGIRMDARSNRRWPDALQRVTARGEASRRAVVLAFGTNAGMDEEAVAATLDVIGPDRMVVLVNLMGPFARIDSDNASLAAVATRRPNVVVADWAAAVRDHPEELQSDRIHPSLRGAHLFAKTVRQSFATLSERQTGVKIALQDLPIP